MGRFGLERDISEPTKLRDFARVHAEGQMASLVDLKIGLRVLYVNARGNIPEQYIFQSAMLIFPRRYLGNTVTRVAA